MRVLHFQSNGVGSVLSREMNRGGIHSRVLSVGRHPFGYHSDYTLPSRLPVIGPQGLAWWLLKRMARWYDILHSHDGIPLPPAVLKAWEGRVIQHYHNPLSGDFYPGRNIPAFVSVPNMKIPNSTWLPLPVDTEIFYPKPWHNRHLVIGYSYNQDTDLNKLKYIPHDEIWEFANQHKHLVQVFPLTHTRHRLWMSNYYDSIDVYVDRIGLDSYGWQAAEAAMCGCVVVSQFPDSLVECPFLNVTDRQDIVDALESFLSVDLSLDREECIHYAVTYHSVRKVVEKCLAKYSEIL